MENFTETTTSEKSLTFNSDINQYLIETTKWTKFLSILGFVVWGLCVLFFSFSTLTTIGKGHGSPVLVSILGILLIGIIIWLSFYPIHYLFKFSSDTKQAILSNNQSQLVDGFEKLKSYFKFIGICTIVCIACWVVGIIIALGVSSSHFR